MPKEQNFRLGNIVVDQTYQVRMKLDQQKITDYKTYMELGHSFPPLVIDKNNKKLICGFTRYEAYRKLYDPKYKVPVILKNFKSDKDRLTYATIDNCKHGQPLCSWDKKNIITRLQELNMSVEEISDIIGWKISRIQTFAGVTIITKEFKKSKESKVKDQKDQKPSKKKKMIVKVDDQDKPLKRGLNHLNGSNVDKKVYKKIANHYIGITDQVLIKQLIMRIDNDLINIVEPKVKELLTDLHTKIEDLI